MTISRIEAVNVALAMLGEAPVTSLGPNAAPVAALAEVILDEVDREVQSEGWRFNYERDVALVPDGSGEVALVDVISVDGERWGRDLVLRGERVWDADRNSYAFPGSVLYVDLVRKLDWDDLPDSARLYIARRTGRVLQDRVFKDRARQSIAFQEEIAARAALQNEENRGDVSSFLDAWPQARIRLRRSPEVF